MRHIFLLPAITCLLSTAEYLHAQGDETKTEKLSPKEFAIPASPVFDLMGVTPSQINRTSDIKDFKVDWSFKSWRLNPNLAIESQPIWELLYNRKELTKYQKASSFMRHFASLDVSGGTVQNEDNDRRIGYAVKLNLFKQKDPLLAKGFYEDISARYQDERKQLEDQLKELNQRLDTLANILEKPALREQINATEEQLLSIVSRRNAEINARAKIFSAENWNASSLDIAFGHIYTYQTDSTGSLIKLRLNRNTGWGAWINGSFGMGQKFLVSGLIRTTWYREELNFLLKNKNTGDETSDHAIADNRLYSAGLNIRYGSAVYSFFAELLYERKSLTTPVEALNKTFSAPSPDVEVVGSSVKWSVVHPNTLSFGGDWRVNRNVILNYGMRCVFTRDWKFETFTPVVSVACMMR